MQLISETLFADAARRGRITLADVHSEVASLKGYGIHRTTESELWHGSLINKDLFEPGAREVFEDALKGRLERLYQKGPSLTERAATMVGWKIDSDGDGLSDAQERKLGSNPFRADTNENGWSDKREVERGVHPGRVFDWK